MEAPAPPSRTGPAFPELLIALGLLGCAGIVLWQTGEIPATALFTKVGPTVFPGMVAGGLALLAALLLWQAWHGGWQPADESEVGVDWHAVSFVAAGLLANVALIGPLGFTAARVVACPCDPVRRSGRADIRLALPAA